MQKTFILLGAILLAFSAQAQTTDGNNNIGADTASRYGMHRDGRHHEGSDRDGRDGFRSFRHDGGGWAGGGGDRGGRGRDGARGLHYTPEQRSQIRDINT